MKTLKKILLVVVASCASFLSFQVVAKNSIESVEVARQGSDIVLKIGMKEALVAVPPGFAVAKPSRIAFDLPAVDNALGVNSKLLNEGSLRSLNIVQADERTRLVLSLTSNMNYSTRLEGTALYILLSPIQRLADNVSAVPPTRFAETRIVGPKSHVIEDITFRRGKDGEGRVVVDLSDTGSGIDIRQQGSALIIDFLKTSVPPSLSRNLDVTDFATPILSVETKAQADNVQMTIKPTGIWEHNAYQSDKQFIVEVKRIVEDPNKLVQGSKVGYQGPRVSINYQNGDVRALLRLMAEELGLNAVISETVTGTTTLVLKDVPADQVIDIIFQQKGLDMRKKENIIMIAPRDEIALREKQEFEARQQLSELEPLKLEQFALSYQKAKEVAVLLQGQLGGGGIGGVAAPGRILSKRGNAVADAHSNKVFVTDMPTKLEEVRAFIKAIDVGARQVMIEARIVEANDNFNRNLGVKLNFLSQAKGADGRFGAGLWSPKVTDDLGVVTKNAGQADPSTFGVNLPSFNNAGGTLAFSLFNRGLTRILNVELAALENDGGGKVISSPRVITANNVKAKIEDGTDVPYVTPGTTSAPPTVSFKAAKLSLEVTPQITPEGAVKMELVVKKEEPDWTRAIQGNPPLKSSVVETNVVVDNGGTVVIGGVFTTSKQKSVEKVPFLGDIPILGWLFKTQIDTADRRELLIFITPRVLSDKLRIE